MDLGLTVLSEKSPSVRLTYEETKDENMAVSRVRF